MRVLVTGSRTWQHAGRVHKCLGSLKQKASQEPHVLIHGDCKRGVDAIAHAEAKRLGWYIIKCPAQWKRNVPAGMGYNPRAGPERNDCMVRSFAPFVDVYLVCIRGNSKGSTNCLKHIYKYRTPQSCVWILRE